MSRVIHLNENAQVITALCEKFSLGISTIEPLPSGGTRVVTTTSDNAVDLRKRMKDKIIDGTVTRSGIYAARRRMPG